MYTSKHGRHLLPVVALLYSAALWGVVWYPLRLLEQSGLAGVWTSLISYGAALVVFLWVFVRESRALYRNLVPLGVMTVAVGWCNVSFIMAVLDGHVLRVLLLFYLSPFWAVCLGWLLLGERPDRRSLLVFVIAVVGALVMLWNEEVHMPWPRDEADWLAVSSGFAFALGNVYVRRMQDVSVWLKSACSWLGVVVVAAAWVMLAAIPFPAVGTGVVTGAVVLGLGGFLTMSLAVLYGVTHMPVYRSSVILLFELVAGALSAQWLTDEVVLPREWLGGVLIVTAAWLTARIHAREHA